MGFSYTGAPHRPDRCRSIRIGSHVGAVAQALVWASPPVGPRVWVQILRLDLGKHFLEEGANCDTVRLMIPAELPAGPSGNAPRSPL
jgi:hypothetical protein